MSNTLKNSLYLLAALGLAASSLVTDAFAVENIIRPYESARSAAMGGVKLTTGLYDENFFANPARNTANPTWKISLIDLTAEINSSLISNVGSFTSGGGDTITKVANTAGSNNHARIQTAMPAFYIPNFWGSKNSFAFGLFTNTQADVDLRRSYQIQPDVITDIGPAFSYARKFMKDDKLSVGATVRLAYRLSGRQGYSFVDLIKGNSISPAQSGGDGSEIDGDIGATYAMPFHPKGIDFTSAVAIDNVAGGTYSNLKIKLLKTGIRPIQQPRSYGFGMKAHKPHLWVFSDPELALEFTDIGNNPSGSYFRTVHFGGEMRWGIFRPRAGINQGYWCGGLGINLKVLEIDLASYGEELSLNPGQLQDRRYAVKVAIQI